MDQETAAHPPESADLALTEEQTKLFAAYITSKKILIADVNQSIRSSLSKTLIDLGRQAKLHPAGVEFP